MKVKPNITCDGIEREIIIPTPRERKVWVKPEENGYLREQLFISENLPSEITYEFIGLVRFPDGSLYPKYKANAVTVNELWLSSLSCYERGIETINRICWELTWQEGLIDARSIKKSDLKCFDYTKESFSYWLASPTIYDKDNVGKFGPGNVIDGIIDGGYGNKIYESEEFINGGLPVRPVIILATKVVENPLSKMRAEI